MHQIKCERAAATLGGRFKTVSCLPKPFLHLSRKAFRFLEPAVELGIRCHCASCKRFRYGRRATNGIAKPAQPHTLSVSNSILSDRSSTCTMGDQPGEMI